MKQNSKLISIIIEYLQYNYILLSFSEICILNNEYFPNLCVIHIIETGVIGLISTKFYSMMFYVYYMASHTNDCAIAKIVPRDCVKIFAHQFRIVLYLFF